MAIVTLTATLEVAGFVCMNTDVGLSLGVSVYDNYVLSKKTVFMYIYLLPRPIIQDLLN